MGIVSGPHREEERMSITIERPSNRASSAWESSAGFLLEPLSSRDEINARDSVPRRHSARAELAVRDIFAMILEGQISRSCGARSIRALSTLLTSGAPAPHLRAVDEEVSALWLNGKMSLELSIPDPDEQIYVRRTDESGKEQEIGFYPTVPDATRDFLKHFG